MLVRQLKFLYALIVLECVNARFALMPKFYGQDSAIIVDTDRAKLNPKLQNALYYNIPVYKLINPSTGQQNAIKSTTTARPTFNEEQYPSDLLYIARNKLGLNRIDQLPSISELGELLGTSNAADTIKYIRTLTSNDQGIALMKSYLDSMDYGPNEPDADSDIVPQAKYDEDDNVTDNADMDADYDDVPLIKLPPKLTTTTTTTKAPEIPIEEGSFMQRFNDFMKQYNLWTDSSTTPKPAPFKPVFVQPQQPVNRVAVRPMLVRQPLPYHYPIPLRPVLLTKSVKPTATPMPTTTAAPMPTTTVAPITTPTPSQFTQALLPPHLNTPKNTAALSKALVAPHVQQLAKIANIPPQVLDQFLQQQPKLADLALRVSRLPLVQQHSQAIDSQLLMAVKKALSQDENLQMLLASSQTLK